MEINLPLKKQKIRLDTFCSLKYLTWKYFFKNLIHSLILFTQKSLLVFYD